MNFLRKNILYIVAIGILTVIVLVPSIREKISAQLFPIAAVEQAITLTDADYDEFKARVLKADFKYDRETEKYLKDLEKLAKFEGYYDDAKPEFEALKKKLSHNVAKDLDYNKEYIKQLLENEIVAAYYFQAGAIQNSLRYDKQIKEAVKLLNSPEEYSKILRPAKK